MKERIKRMILLCSVMLPVLLVAACAKPKAELSVSKTQIKQGESVSVNWTTQNAKEVTLNGQKVAKTGTEVFQPTTTTSFELVGRRGSKEARDTEKVLVEVLAASPTITFTADPNAIGKGEKARLRWSSQNANSVEIPGLGSFGASGEREVAPFESTTYTATAKGPGGEASASARVTVTADIARTPETRTVDEGALKRRFDENIRPIFFDFDKSDLRQDAIDTLQKNARFLLQSENRSMVFRVEGNCDPRGSEEYNLALGDKRANSAKTYLISQGVDPSRMDVISNGKRNAAGNSEGSPNNPPSWAHDRRDDFIYVRGGEQILRPSPND
jgi:peptidoglycan-associated lipoprotein